MQKEFTGNALHIISSISADIFGYLGCFILLVALGLSKGKDSLIVFLLALYPAGLITEYFPFYDLFARNSQLIKDFSSLFIFLSSLVAVIFFIKGYIDTNYQHHTFWRVVEVIVLAIVSVGLFFALLYHLVGVTSLYDFSFVFDALFSSKIAFFIWLIAPLLSIPLFVRA